VSLDAARRREVATLSLSLTLVRRERRRPGVR
jgi:hypothetical protein